MALWVFGNAVSSRTDGPSFWGKPPAQRTGTYTQKQGEPVSEAKSLPSP